MSWTEYRSREGLPYGGMPYDVVLDKLEETNPELVDDVRGRDEFHDIEDEYNDYARGEIIDWRPDVPFLESDQPRRDPALGRSILNLRYNGTRGSNPELPRHPELFYGFTDQDPRGVVNDPRFEQVRGHITARAGELTVRMGNNDDHQEAERPWTNQSISYGKKEIMRRMKHNMRIFAVQKEGRPLSRNYVADPTTARLMRAAAMGAGCESLGRFGENARDAAGGGIRGLRGDHGGRAPWRHAIGEADLGVQQYGQNRGVGALARPGSAAVGAKADQSWTESQRGGSTNRQTLAATMAAAARYRRAATSARPDQAPTESFSGQAVGAGLAPAHIGAIYRNYAEDQTRRQGQVQDGAGGYDPASGLAPHANSGQARYNAAEDRARTGLADLDATLGAAAHLAPATRMLRSREATVTPNGCITNAVSIVAGLREGTAAGRRRIAGQVVADGARPALNAENAPAAGLAPGADYGAVARRGEAAVVRAAAAEGLVLHAYGLGVPDRPAARVAAARGGDDPSAWQVQDTALAVGASRAPGEWRSATQGQTTLGDEAGVVFGATMEVSGGSAPVGPKSLRAGDWSDSAGLTDSLTEDFGAAD